jgi:hypothetical protein
MKMPTGMKKFWEPLEVKKSGNERFVISNFQNSF